MRTYLTSDQAFYIADGGSDANDGSLASPWATLQHAYDWIRDNIDFGGRVVCLNDSLALSEAFAPVGACTGQRCPADLVINGDVGNSWGRVIRGESAIFASEGAQFKIQGFAPQATGSGNDNGFGLAVARGCRIVVGPMGWSSCPSGYITATEASISITGGQAITQGSGGMLISEAGSKIICNAQNLTLVGALHWSVAFLIADQNSIIDTRGTGFYTNAPNTGNRAAASASSTIYTDTTIPGNLSTDGLQKDSTSTIYHL